MDDENHLKHQNTRIVYSSCAGIKEEDWQVICKHSLFSTRLLQLEEICDSEYNGNSHEFTINYLKPVVELFDDIRSRCEEYYGHKSRNKSGGQSWIEAFENIIKYAIHPNVLKCSLHKGDFYIHISSTIPRTLELKYFHLGEIKAQTLSMTDCILMCSENWTELLRFRDRFVFSSCIIWSYRFDRVSWKNLLKAIFAGRIDAMEGCSEKSSLQLSSSSSICETLSAEDLTEESSLILNLNFELLHSQVAYIPGSRDTHGRPVIYINAKTSCWDYIKIDSEELSKVLVYYYKIPRVSVQRKSCSVVIDAREKQLSVNIMECIAEAIITLQLQNPGSVHMAFVVTRKESVMLIFQSSKIKESMNFDFQFVTSIGSLSQYIPMEQLPVSFAGKLHYNHEEWIKFRTKIEPFMTGCRSATKHAMNYIQEISRTDTGYNLADANTLLELHRTKIKEVLEDTRLLGLQEEGKRLIKRISAEECSNMTNQDYTDTLDCVKRLYNQMNKIFDRLKDLSDKRSTHLEICKKIKEFEEDSQKIIDWIRSEGVLYLEKCTETGDSLSHAQSSMEDFENFSTISEKQMDHSEEIILKGKYLTEVDELGQGNVKDKLMELELIIIEYSTKYNERLKKVKQSLDFYTLIEQVGERWANCLKFAATMNMEDIQTIDGIHRLKSSLLDFMAENPAVTESESAKITELAHHLGSNQVKQAEQVNSRSADAQIMLKNKESQINGAVVNVMMNNNNNNNNNRRDSVIYGDGDDTSLCFRDGDLSTEVDEDDYREPSCRYSDSPPSSFGDSAVGRMYSWKDDSSHYYENDSKIAMFDAAMPPKLKERIEYIIGELISTENEYVESLEYVIDNYMSCMDIDNVIPVLKGKKNVLFGNIKKIYDFHKRYFCEELATFKHNPLQIGRCFLKWERQFSLYALYNKNKPNSDQLWNDYANTFFQSKMKELNDKLDLASYLIKPVQRLGKYALLLKDMISCCDPNDPRVKEIADAYKLMNFQLRHGNDLLAMDAILHSDINLKEQGCLFRQADFFVYYGKRKRVRRVFLFEHALVFTKAKKQKAKGDSFSYKHSIKTVDLGLTETIGESGLKFEVWYRRWKKGGSSDAYIFQAGSAGTKRAWTEELTRILWRQASRNKEYGLSEASTGISVESLPSSIFIDTGSSNSFNGSNSFTRHRNVPEISSPRESQRSNNKRYSWLSTEESSGSSGVHDLESLPEDGHSIFSPRTELDIKFSTLPRKQQQYVRSTSEQQATTLSNNPVTLRRDMPGNFNPNFIRTNVFRKTVHVESKTDHSKIQKAPERRSLKMIGRCNTQPIILPSNDKKVTNFPVKSRSGTNNIITDAEAKSVDKINELSAKEVLRNIDNLNRQEKDVEIINNNCHVLMRSSTDFNIKRRTTGVQRSATDDNIVNNHKNNSEQSGLYSALGSQSEPHSARVSHVKHASYFNSQNNEDLVNSRGIGRKRNDVNVIDEDPNFELSQSRPRQKLSDCSIPCQ